MADKGNGEGFFSNEGLNVTPPVAGLPSVNVVDGDLTVTSDEYGRVVLLVGDNGLVIPADKLDFIAGTFRYIAELMRGHKS